MSERDYCMKKLLTIFCLLIFSGSTISSYASPKINEVQIPATPHLKYAKQYFDGYENNSFSRRSYYLPTYCQPGAAMNSGMNNPFCNQYLPYGSGFYTNF